jgi:hypothetical protein
MVSRKPKNPWENAAKNAAKNAASNVGKKASSTAKGAAKFAFGDPKKGWQDVAINTGTWLIPYSKGAKVINKGVNTVVKGKKTSKVVRGVAKGSGAVGAVTALEKGVNSTRKSNDLGSQRAAQRAKKKK